MYVCMYVYSHKHMTLLLKYVADSHKTYVATTNQLATSTLDQGLGQT